MNPMLRWASAIHDVRLNQLEERMQRKRDAQKVKLRQEKETRRLDAIERDNKRRSEQPVEKEGAEAKNEESAACKFQKELCWCIQQLETGLASGKSKSQAPEAQRLLKILKSSKAPMARKRQVMRASFGNYRALMQQEETKHTEEMQRKKGLAPVESDKLGTALFFRRANSAHPCPFPSGSARFVSVQPAISEVENEGTSEEDHGGGEGEGEGEERGSVDSREEEDPLMKSLELETMDMHLCKSDAAHVSNDNKNSMESFEQDESVKDNEGKGPNWEKRAKSEGNREEDNEKENIPRTPTDTDDTNQSQISSNYSSTASLFSFNFEIKEEDMDLLEGHRPFIATATSISEQEGVDPLLMRGVDNRASDSTSSGGGTPSKRASRRRNRGKKRQQKGAGNEDQRCKQSPKEALLTGSPKIELSSSPGGFKFSFPDPIDTSTELKEEA